MPRAIALLRKLESAKPTSPKIEDLALGQEGERAATAGRCRFRCGTFGYARPQNPVGDLSSVAQHQPDQEAGDDGDVGVDNRHHRKLPVADDADDSTEA
jgi:hypothetical protein